MSGLGAVFGLIGGFIGRRYTKMGYGPIFIVEMAIWGFLLTFTYDVMGSVGFFLAYPIYPSVWEAIYLTFVPTLYMPYPPIMHTFTNTAVFAYFTPPLIKAMTNLPSIISRKAVK